MKTNHFIKKTIYSFMFKICFLGLFAASAQADCGGFNAPKLNKTVKVDFFHSLEISGKANVFIQPGETTSLNLKAAGPVIEDLEIEVSSGKLIIEPDDCDKTYNVYVTMQQFESLDFSGSTTVESTSVINTKALQVQVSGSAKIKLAIAADIITLESSGSSKITLDLTTEKFKIGSSGSSTLVFSGSAQTVLMEGSGSYDLDAFELKVKKFTLNSSGSSQLKLNIEESLVAETSGSMDIRYKGQPKISISTSGSTNLKAID